MIGTTNAYADIYDLNAITTHRLKGVQSAFIIAIAWSPALLSMIHTLSALVRAGVEIGNTESMPQSAFIIDIVWSPVLSMDGCGDMAMEIEIRDPSRIQYFHNIVRTSFVHLFLILTAIFWWVALTDNRKLDQVFEVLIMTWMIRMCTYCLYPRTQLILTQLSLIRFSFSSTIVNRDIPSGMSISWIRNKLLVEIVG